MITELDTPERVHYAMLSGQIARITMMQCAHTWGAQTVMDLAKANELRGDLKTVSDVLIDYDGDTPWQQAQAALAEIQWLKNELMISQKNEYAFKQVLEQEQAAMFALRSKLRLARACMEANDHLNARVIFGPYPSTEEHDHEQDARQTAGLTSKV